MNDVPATPGARLRAAREQRGMSVPKAAAELHLEPWAIEALESGDYGRIGPTVYAKGYLKRYAMLLGLPVEEMLAGFGGAPLVAQAVHTPLASAREPAPARTVSTTQMAIATSLMLLAVALAWWKPWEQRAAAPLAAAPEPSTPRAADIPAEPPAPAKETPVAVMSPPPVRLAAPPAAAKPPSGATRPLALAAQPASSAGADPATAVAAQLPGAGKARLRLSFTSDSWVDVRDALGNRAFAGTGAANTVRNISGQAPMHVYLRIASGVQLEINGHVVAIGPQYFAGDAARFEAGADGVLRRESRHESTAANTRPPG